MLLVKCVVFIIAQAKECWKETKNDSENFEISRASLNNALPRVSLGYRVFPAKPTEEKVSVVNLRHLLLFSFSFFRFLLGNSPYVLRAYSRFTHRSYGDAEMEYESSVGGKRVENVGVKKRRGEIIGERSRRTGSKNYIAPKSYTMSAQGRFISLVCFTRLGEGWEQCSEGARSSLVADTSSLLAPSVLFFPSTRDLARANAPFSGESIRKI